MKYFTILLIIIIVGLISFTGCEKKTVQDLPTNNSNETLTVDTRSLETVGSWGIHRHFFDNGGDDFGCKEPPETCFDDVIVTPKNDNIKKALHKIIDNHNEGNNVLERDISIFKEYANALSEFIFTREDIDNLINGIYHLRIRGSKLMVSKTENNYYIFERGTKIEKVYPVKIAK